MQGERALFGCFFASLLCFQVESTLSVASSIDPFGDSNLYRIEWLEALQTQDKTVEALSDQTEQVIVTKENEKYVCFFKDRLGVKNKNLPAGEYTGPDELTLLESLTTQRLCAVKSEPYWTYELCHGRHIRQYHDVRDPRKGSSVVDHEYSLGAYSASVTQQRGGEQKEHAAGADDEKENEQGVSSEGETKQEVDKDSWKDDVTPQVMRVDGRSYSYFSTMYEGGTSCDINGVLRKTEVKYICHPDGRGELYEIKEESSCQYVAIVATSLLCSHPKYSQKTLDVNKIGCHSMNGSPKRPRALDVLEQEKILAKYHKRPTPQKAEFEEIVFGKGGGKAKLPPTANFPELDEEEEEEEEEVEEPEIEFSTKEEEESRRTPIGAEVDSDLLERFLSGDHCISGGSGWWRHEFCFGRHAVQYHPEGPGKRTEILLGKWDPEAHREWMYKNPSKLPKAVSERKHISLFYSSGSVCDLTGKQRRVEVKLKCPTGSDVTSQHYVSIYMLEPKTCEYILTVESPILCQVIAKADKFGFITQP